VILFNCQKLSKTNWKEEGDLELHPFVNQRSSTKDYVYYELKKRIIGGILKPDQALIEENLTKELDISRTPLREALTRLEIEELVVRQPNGRLKVASISIEEAKEIFNVRSLLEGLIAREATINATDVDIQKLQDITQLIAEASESNRADDVVRYGSEFHTVLYQLSSNRTASKILLQLNDHIARYRRLGPTRDHDRGRRAAQEHRELFEAIVSKNFELAEQLMREHINNSMASAIESIEKHVQEQD
jgi:DNA-binding GntR family transcriptional regulator